MNKGSSFWREVIDHLPHLILLFRVDKTENAHLIFVNKKITSWLGYTPKEYILNSESAGQISRELKQLIDEIARRSHDVDKIFPRPCVLSTKNDEKKSFDIDFKLFSTSSQKSNLIAVVLQPGGTARSSKESSFNEAPTSVSYSGTKPLVYQSDLMHAVLEKGKRLLSNPGNILFLGEKGVGKSTLAYHLLENEKSDYEIIQYDTWADVNVEEIVPDGVNQQKKYLLFIKHIDSASKTAQEQLLRVIDGRLFKNNTIKIVATSIISLEQLMDDGSLLASLYYKLAFSTILVPPLRQRPDDIVEVAQRYIKYAQQLPGISEREVEEDEFKKLKNHHWDHNFKDLFQVLNNALLRDDAEKITFKVAAHAQSSLFPEENISVNDILSFEEMNRRYLKRILEITSGKIYGDDGAANLVDLKPTTLQSKLKKLGLR